MRQGVEGDRHERQGDRLQPDHQHERDREGQDRDDRSGIFALVSFVKSVRLPAGPPTATSVPLVFANAAADVWRSSPSSRVVCVLAACCGTTTI